MTFVRVYVLYELDQGGLNKKDAELGLGEGWLLVERAMLAEKRVVGSARKN